MIFLKFIKFGFVVLKGDYLLSGDVDGIMQVFNIKLKQSK